MTCIVGIVDSGRVWLAGDSVGVSGLDATDRADEKVFANGPFLIGFTTSFRMGQLLRYAFVPPDVGTWDLRRYMATTFVDAMRACFKAGGWLGTDSADANREQGGFFLVAYKDQLFEIQSDFQVAVPRCGYVAVGCGQSYALGSLFSTRGQSPEARLQAALSAAEYHTAGVRGPFTVLSTSAA